MKGRRATEDISEKTRTFDNQAAAKECTQNRRKQAEKNNAHPSCSLDQESPPIAHHTSIRQPPLLNCRPPQLRSLAQMGPIFLFGLDWHESLFYSLSPNGPSYFIRKRVQRTPMWCQMARIMSVIIRGSAVGTIELMLPLAP